MKDPNVQKEWEKELIVQMAHWADIGDDGGLYVHPEKAAEFINNLLASHNNSLVERLEWLKKVHKEFECNGAHGGRGCFESWCEDQDCRNAPKEHNKAITEAQELIKNN